MCYTVDEVQKNKTVSTFNNHQTQRQVNESVNTCHDILQPNFVLQCFHWGMFAVESEVFKRLESCYHLIGRCLIYKIYVFMRKCDVSP